MSQTTQERRRRSELFLGITYFDIIGIIITFGVGFIPAPPPLTHVGMVICGVLLGIVFMYTFVGPTWTSLVSLLALAPVAKQLLGGPHGAWSLTAISTGDWLLVYIMLCMLLTYPLAECGFLNRVAFWFMTRKFSRKSPWNFLLMIILTCFIMANFVETDATIVFFFGVALALFKRVGFRPGEKYPACVLIGLMFAGEFGMISTPLGHGAGLKGMTALATALHGGSLQLIPYFIIIFPCMLVVSFVLYLVLRYLVKPDISKMANIESAVMGERPGPMERREKIVVTVYAITVFFWILPGFLDLFAPQWAFTRWLDEQTPLAVGVCALIILSIIKIEKKPLFDFQGAFASLPWAVFAVIAAVRALTTLLGNKGTGFNLWFAQITNGFVGLPPWSLMIVLIVVFAILTQFTSNTMLDMLAVSVLAPQAAALGVAAPIIAVLITASTNAAFTLPSGFPMLCYLTGNEWNLTGTQIKTGALITLASVVMFSTLGYAISLALF